jgi:hypothetical protein
MKPQLQNVANESVIINSVTFLCNLNLINNYIYLILSFSNNRERFKRASIWARSSELCYICVCQKKRRKKRIRLLPAAITIITTITSIHFLSLSLLYRRWRLQLLCVTHIPCFWKWWWKNAHNGRKRPLELVLLRSFVCSRGFLQIMLVPIENEKELHIFIN